DLNIAEIETELGREGFTLNYFVPPDNQSLLVDALNRRIPNLYGAAFGGIEDLCLKVKWSRADGKVFTNVAAPRSATGPSLKKLAIGSANWVGLPIQAVLRIFSTPLSREVTALGFASGSDRESFLRAMLRPRLAPPLLAKLDRPPSLELLEDLGSDGVLGLSWWGEDEPVRAMAELLEGLSKKGRRLEMRDGWGEDELLERLQLAGMAEWEERI